jgi:hypothetical protein
MMILLQRMPRNGFAQAFQQATAMWNVDSMAGTADAVNYVQRNAADPSREALRQHVQSRNAIGQPVVVGAAAGGGSFEDLMDVTDEQLARMKAMLEVKTKDHEMKMEMQYFERHRMILNHFSNSDPTAYQKEVDEYNRRINYDRAWKQLSEAKDPDTVHLLQLTIKNELRLRNNLAAVAPPADMQGMKTVMNFIMADDERNRQYAREIGREMARMYRESHYKEPMSGDMDPATGFIEKLYTDEDIGLFHAAKTNVLVRKSKGLRVEKGQGRLNFERR